MSLLLVLLRHGRSEADDLRIHEGRYDSALTERGRQQAEERLADFEQQGLSFDRVVSSPLARARATAEVISRGLGAPLVIDPDWTEMDKGWLAGLPFDEAARRFPKPASRDLYRRYHEGESVAELHARALRAVARIAAGGEGRVLVVSHGAILNAAMRCLLGIAPAPDEAGAHFAFGDLGYAILTYHPQKHAWRLLRFETGMETPNPGR